jgi:uncharacterized membrane protein
VITATLYTKNDCSLCEQALADLNALQEKIPHNLALINIDEDEDLRKAYAERVPVLQVGPYVLEAPFDRPKIEMTLAAARDRVTQMADDPKYQKRKARSNRLDRADRIGKFLSGHYLAILNFLIFLYVGLPFLAPVLMNAGYPAAARPIYTAYGAVCHQLAYRSWFLFGDQHVYPRAAAELENLQSYEQVTGNNSDNLLQARGFIGNEQLGYKVAFCQRDVAIYGSMLLFGLIFAATGRRIKPLHWALWIAIGMAPIALDGFSQLFSQLPGFSLWSYRESTPLLRTLTGAIFGFTTMWFGLPLLEESFIETRTTLASKTAVIRAKKTKK